MSKFDCISFSFKITRCTCFQKGIELFTKRHDWFNEYRVISGQAKRQVYLGQLVNRTILTIYANRNWSWFTCCPLSDNPWWSLIPYGWHICCQTTKPNISVGKWVLCATGGLQVCVCTRRSRRQLSMRSWRRNSWPEPPGPNHSDPCLKLTIFPGNRHHQLWPGNLRTKLSPSLELSLVSNKH